MRVAGSTRTLFIMREIDDQAVVTTAESGAVVAAAADREQQALCSRAKLTAAMTSAASTHRAISRGRLSIMPLYSARASS